MKRQYIMAALISAVSFTAFADDRVLPAQADDIAKADANLGAATVVKNKSSSKSNRDSRDNRDNNFGATVSAEARTLRNADLQTRQQFGESISDQRAKNPTQAATNGGAAAASGSANSSAAGSVSAGAPSNPLSHVPSHGGGASGHVPPTRP
ncbi:MAG: hypothetical protein C5B49_07940 [Bdellovibrio sp.]|nr:MAG: hypothetical protein C5B49_07940 [Bdellovibrio sp.]